MPHFELRFSVEGNENQLDFLVAILADEGCNSFMEEADKLLAYIETEAVDDKHYQQLLFKHKIKGASYLGHEAMPEKNWNAEWESGYEAVTIAGRCLVRAPFHQPQSDVQHEIVIMPRMSFGTAHHETTAMMIELLLDTEVKGKTLLDMGCGTAVLAILARKMGAVDVVAIDNDQWAYENAKDNVALNDTADINVLMGDAGLLDGKHFDVVLANINRNILLADMHAYAKATNPSGLLVLSGFYKHDLEAVHQKAAEYGFRFVRNLEKNNWIAAQFSHD